MIEIGTVKEIDLGNGSEISRGAMIGLLYVTASYTGILANSELQEITLSLRSRSPSREDAARENNAYCCPWWYLQASFEVTQSTR